MSASVLPFSNAPRCASSVFSHRIGSWFLASFEPSPLPTRTRMAYVEVRADERPEIAVGFGRSTPAAKRSEMANVAGAYSYAASDRAGRDAGTAVGPLARLSARRNAAVARFSLSR